MALRSDQQAELPFSSKSLGNHWQSHWFWICYAFVNFYDLEKIKIQSVKTNTKILVHQVLTGILLMNLFWIVAQIKVSGFALEPSLRLQKLYRIFMIRLTGHEVFHLRSSWCSASFWAGSRCFGRGRFYRWHWFPPCSPELLSKDIFFSLSSRFSHLKLFFGGFSFHS